VEIDSLKASSASATDKATEDLAAMEQQLNGQRQELETLKTELAAKATEVEELKASLSSAKSEPPQSPTDIKAVDEEDDKASTVAVVSAGSSPKKNKKKNKKSGGQNDLIIPETETVAGSVEDGKSETTVKTEEVEASPVASAEST